MNNNFQYYLDVSLRLKCHSHSFMSFDDEPSPPKEKTTSTSTKSTNIRSVEETIQSASSTVVNPKSIIEIIKGNSTLEGKNFDSVELLSIEFTRVKDSKDGKQTAAFFFKKSPNSTNKRANHTPLSFKRSSEDSKDKRANHTPLSF